MAQKNPVAATKKTRKPVTQKNKDKKVPSGTRSSPATSEPEEESKGTAASLKEAITKFENKISKSAAQVKMADYVRMLQLQKELENEGPKEVTVRWVDPWAKEPSTEK